MLVKSMHGTEIWIKSDPKYRCPECGHSTWEYVDPSDDPAMSTYCCNNECPYTVNQYMTWEEIKEHSLTMTPDEIHEMSIVTITDKEIIVDLDAMDMLEEGDEIW